MNLRTALFGRSYHGDYTSALINLDWGYDLLAEGELTLRERIALRFQLWWLEEKLSIYEVRMALRRQWWSS